MSIDICFPYSYLLTMTLSPFKHHIVVLEASASPLPHFAFPHTRGIYDHTYPHEIAERIRDATIVIVDLLPITAKHICDAPKLQCLTITATGVDWLDRQAFADRGITVVNCPQSNVDAVAEHFLTLYFSGRRKVVEIHNAIAAAGDPWIKERSLTTRWTQGPPLSCQQETLGIIGYGAIGRKIELLARGVGMARTLIAERKGADQIRVGRVAFEEIIKDATTLVVCCPKKHETVGLISRQELEAMKPEALLLNLSRGGIVHEQDLADALRTGSIFGAATDVLETEPGGVGTSPLLPDTARGEAPVPNLTLSSHIAWFSRNTIQNILQLLKLGIEGFVSDSLLEAPSRSTVIVYKGEIIR